MINYIRNTNEGAKVYPSHSVCGRSSLGYIKKLCMKQLFTLDGYLKALKNELNISYKAPIFINYDLIFISTKSLKHYDNIFINFTQIKEVNDLKDSIGIIFKNNDYLEVEISPKTYKRLAITIFNLYKYKESLV